MLSICIPSYNRPKELDRLLDSIVCANLTNYEVVISDDCSPLSSSIKDVVKTYSNKLNIRFFYQESNLGYDKNLVFLSNAATMKFIMFIGDDDYINSTHFHGIIEELENYNTSFILTPVFGLQGSIRRKFSKNFTTTVTSKKSLSKIAFESILFSGLIFHRENFNAINFNLLGNSIYTQVYSALYLSNKFGFGYIDIPSVYVGNDGDNGFCHNNSIDADLKDRCSIFSDLNYHSRLIKVVDLFSSEYIDIRNDFNYLYNLRLFNRFVNIKINSPYHFKNLRDEVLNRNLSNYFIVNFMYYLILILPNLLVRKFSKLKFLYYKYESLRKGI